MAARKISFQEAWDSSVVFFVDEELEREIDDKVDSLLEMAKNHRVSETAEVSVPSIADFLSEHRDALDVILKDVGLSQEKFMRTVSLLRKLGRIPGGFSSEWGISKIKPHITESPDFAHRIAALLVDGKRDEVLARYIPRYYLDMFNYREIKGSSQAARRVRYKQSLMGTYGGRKGYCVEERIRQTLETIRSNYGVGYTQGRSRMVETDLDFAIPDTNDPWVIIMSSFQETTSSGQTTKAKDMRSAYEQIVHQNSRYGENRVFVNFVDGGGWLARKRDMERLVEHCHYFINLEYLGMLETIVLQHVPEKYFRTVAE